VRIKARDNSVVDHTNSGDAFREMQHIFDNQDAIIMKQYEEIEQLKRRHHEETESLRSVLKHFIDVHAEVRAALSSLPASFPEE
jgi:hypothetical protein